jgi:hypothetical protein
VLLALAILPALAGCAAGRSMGIPIASGAADPEIRTLAQRARAGDKSAQLALGIRYEEGRGVERDPQIARRLYLAALAGRRFQTQYVPVNGAVVAQNSAIGGGRATIWPRSFADIGGYHPSRIAAVLRLCGLEAGGGREPDCPPGDATLLRQLAQIEGNFRACRIRTNFGNAAPAGPYVFEYEPADWDRALETRLCMFEEPVPNGISSDQSMLIWTMWLALSRLDECSPGGACDRAAIARHFTSIFQPELEDSQMWFAIPSALRRSPSRETQVGWAWWRMICDLASPSEARFSPTDAEAKLCSMLRHAGQFGMR